MTSDHKRYIAMGRSAATLADDKHGERISLLCVRHLTTVTDYFLIVSADSSVQLRAIREHIYEGLKKEFGVMPINTDGFDSVQWTVLDYAGLVVHILIREARDFYQLERLWEGARKTDWKQVAEKPLKKSMKARSPGKRVSATGKRRAVKRITRRRKNQL